MKKLICLAALLICAASDARVVLTVDRDAGAGTLELSWGGDLAPYELYRGAVAADLLDPANLVTTTGGTTFSLPEGAATLEFFAVLGEPLPIDPASAVGVTSDCLTAATAARAVVVVDLVDTAGDPVVAAELSFSASSGTLGAVESDGLGRYWSELTAPAVPAGALVVDVVADGVTLDAHPSLTVADPIDSPGGGAGGCPADGNLRVRVVDESGAPIDGAEVMVGASEELALFTTSFGAAPDGASTATTGAAGSVTFRDYGGALDGALTVTAAADGRRYVSYVDVDAADVVLALTSLAPTGPTGSFGGAMSGIPTPAGDPIEVGVVLPDLRLSDLLGFSLGDVFGDSECYAAGGVAGDLPLPSNAYMPDQCAVVFIFCVQSLPEKDYSTPPIAQGERRMLGLRGSLPLDDATGGGDIATAVTLDGIGAVTQTLAASTQTLDVPISANLSPNLDCTIDNPPLNSDVYCVAGGDWDAQAGAGRLFLMGYLLEDSAATPPPLTISGVTTVVDSGEFAGIDYIAGAVAQYADPAKPGIPPGTERGTSVVLDRSGSFDGAGGTLTFDDFFPIRPLARVGRDVTVDPLPGTGHPGADVTRFTVLQRITENYQACEPDDSTRTRDVAYWDLYAPGAGDAIALPSPPSYWPRAGLTPDLAGLVDPAVTPEDDVLLLEAQTLHLGSLGVSFDFNALRLSDLATAATHATSNQVDF